MSKGKSGKIRLCRILLFYFILVTPVFLNAHTSQEKADLQIKIERLQNKITDLEQINSKLIDLEKTTKANYLESKNKIDALEADKKSLIWWLSIIGGSFAGLTLFSLFKLFKTTIPKLVKEEAQKRIDLHLTSDTNQFKNIRMAVLNKTGKDAAFHKKLVGIGFSNEKLTPYSIEELGTINVKINDYLFIKDDDDSLSAEELKLIVEKFGNQQIKYFYFGPKRFSPEMFQKIKHIASTEAYLESNLLKSVRV